MLRPAPVGARPGALIAWLRFLVDGLAKERDAARREADRWREEAERSRRSEAEALADAAQARAELSAYLAAQVAASGSTPPAAAPSRPKPTHDPPPQAIPPAPSGAAVLRAVERAVEGSLALTPDDLRLRRLAAQHGGVESLRRLVTGAVRLLKIAGVENVARKAQDALHGTRSKPPLAAKGE